MPNIADIIEVAEELEDKAVVPASKRCVAVRNRNASCRKCIDACPADAISVHNNVLSVDHKACVACGADRRGDRPGGHLDAGDARESGACAGEREASDAAVQVPQAAR